jgi:hypothetical protein
VVLDFIKKPVFGNKGMKAREQVDLKKTVYLDKTVEIVFATFTMYTICGVNGLIKDKKELLNLVSIFSGEDQIFIFTFQGLQDSQLN